jgi:hypothetical protein
MRTIIVFLFFTSFCFSQVEYPQDYFRNPLDITLVLAGTFGELRSNHFHSGLDIKTQRKQGLNVYTAAEGYVSRIKISHYGYGKALYITHPNGYTTVYAHLQKFSLKIERFIKDYQYKEESFEVEVFPNTEELLISKDEIVAFSGNTGGSGGPHLHFEIRDNAERPINPMLFGIDIKDSRAPFVSGVYAYPKDKNSQVDGKNTRVELRLIPNKSGDYSVEGIEAFGTIGFGIISNDKQDLAYNKNGLSNIQTFFNGNKKLEISFKRFSFNESKHINRLIDYEIFKTKKIRVQKLFVQSGNPLSLYSSVDENGYITVEDSTSSVYKIRIRDYQGNATWIVIPIKGKLKKIGADISQGHHNKQFIYADQVLNLKNDNSSVYIPANSFYDNIFLDYSVRSDTINLHKDVVPLQKNFTISYDISNYTEDDKDQLYIARLYGYYRNPGYVFTVRKGDVLSTYSKILGTYTLESDLINPTIKPINFQDGKWLSKLSYLKIKIDDKKSGISNYRATINGKWILMEYDYKTDTLTYDFEDNIIGETENNLKLIVTDNVGNSSTFEATFFRK